MEKKRSIGVTMFGFIFVLLAISILLTRSTYNRPWTEDEARVATIEMAKESGVSLTEESVKRAINEYRLTQPSYYHVRRALLVILFITYIICGTAIFLKKTEKINKVIIVMCIARIIYQFVMVYGYYIGYRVPFVVLGIAKFPIPPLDRDLLYMLSYTGVGILFSIFVIYYFTRPQSKGAF